MLILNRRVGERLIIGDGIIIVEVRAINRRRAQPQAQLGIEAPLDKKILREELLKRKAK